MACRCPVVLSDIPPHREIADGARFIPLAHQDDAAGFARELATLRDMPAREREEIGERCRRLVEERFSLRKMLDEYHAVHKEASGAWPLVCIRPVRSGFGNDDRPDARLLRSERTRRGASCREGLRSSSDSWKMSL